MDLEARHTEAVACPLLVLPPRSSAFFRSALRKFLRGPLLIDAIPFPPGECRREVLEKPDPYFNLLLSLVEETRPSG